ncbi:Reverse transcriptase (RNA-dependent DNA polymerase) [Fragilaria crotonensis]|nr:Reverse transcriptase (RNA-dependent DNA polymerase) [Fragilaria crotonensis]KAI2501828.1 Reverse transcriptase (RNA-dependent DNA polymerase) [Fragilaria crotonensis]
MSIFRTLGSLDVTVEESRTDLDSHADQCAVGHNSLIVHDYDRPINVSGYDPAGPIAKDMRTVSAALAYDDPLSGATVILLVHQAIYIPELSHNLLSPMQVRINDVIINETPRFLTENPDEFTHSILIPEPDMDRPYVIPLGLHGVTSTFPTRKPTTEEYETLPHLCLTSADPPYDPHDPAFASQEHAITASVWNPGDRIGAAPSRRLCSASHTHAVAKAKAIVDGIDAATLSLKQISVTHDDALLAQSLSVLQKHGTGVGKQYTPEQLASNWGIDLTTARRTIDVTTQRGVRTVLHPTLSRRFRTNDRQLRYRRLAIDCFTDTLISNTVSRRNNKYAQIFATSDGWCRAYPMSKSRWLMRGYRSFSKERVSPTPSSWTAHANRRWAYSGKSAAK